MARAQEARKAPLDVEESPIPPSNSANPFTTSCSEKEPPPVFGHDSSSPPKDDPDPLPVFSLPPPRVSPPSSSDSDEQDNNRGKYSRRKRGDLSPLSSICSGWLSSPNGTVQESADPEDLDRMCILPDDRAQEASSDFGGLSIKDGNDVGPEDIGAIPVKSNLEINQHGDQINLLERVRELKTLNHKYKQYNLLKKHFDTLKRVETTLDWYEKPDEKSLEDLSGYDVVPCECHLHGLGRFLGHDEKVNLDETERERPSGEIKEAVPSVCSTDPGEHNLTCNIKRLCMYFAGVAKYLTGEDIDHDVFLLDTPPERKYPETEDLIQPAVLNQDHKNTRLRLKQEIDSLLETVDVDMSEEKKLILNERTRNRESIYNCLKRLLKELTEYYDESTDEEMSESSPNASVKKTIKKSVKLNLDAWKNQMTYLNYLILQRKCDSDEKIRYFEPRNDTEEHHEDFKMDETHPVQLKSNAQKNRVIKHKLDEHRSRRFRETNQPKSENEESNEEPQIKKWREAEQKISLSELSLEVTNKSEDQSEEKVYHSDLEVANNIFLS